MKLVIICQRCIRTPWKEYVTLPVEYESKKALIKDFMKLVVSCYKKHAYNYGRGSYFEFIGLRFEASDYYFIFSDKSVRETPPIVLTLEEWVSEYIINGKDSR